MDEPGRSRIVVLRDQRGRGGTRHLAAWLAPDGSLVIGGQDLGPGVEEVWGEGLREYEWTWTVAPADVAAAVAALGGGGGGDPLAAVEDWAARNPGSDAGSRLRSAGVPVAWWSRVGD